MEFKIEKYDKIEMHPCCIADEYELGGRRYRVMEQVEENDPEIAVWSVYGHVPGKGLEWLADCDLKEVAVAIQGFFQSVIDSRRDCPHWNADQEGDFVICPDCGEEWLITFKEN